LWRPDACVAYMGYMVDTGKWASKGDVVQEYEHLLATEGKDRAFGYCAQLLAGMDVGAISHTCTESFHSRVLRHVFMEMWSLVRLLQKRGWQVSWLSRFCALPTTLGDHLACFTAGPHRHRQSHPCGRARRTALRVSAL
jgi:hypothetical protein